MENVVKHCKTPEEQREGAIPAVLNCQGIEAVQENLRLLCGALSVAGHYSPDVLQLLAQEVCITTFAST
jgi:hypothetical protein